MRPASAALVVLGVTLAGCGEAARREPRTAETVQERRRIEVVPGDLSTRDYEVLGWIEWPPRDMFMLFSIPCDAEKLRQAAIEKYGREVDAIVQYQQWREPPAQLRCGGSAVRFRER